MMQFAVKTCSIQLISDRVNAKIAPTSVKEVKETRLSLHVDPTDCYYKSHCVKLALINTYSKYRFVTDISTGTKSILTFMQMLSFVLRHLSYLFLKAQGTLHSLTIAICR